MAYPVYSCTEERFLKDVSQHHLTILKNDGVNRHLRFKRKESGTFWFDLITWGGVLVLQGDCGTYVFSRIEDMFKFFRTAKDDFNYNRSGGLSINPGYWSEKLLSISNDQGGKGFVKEYSQKLFESNIKEWFDSHVQEAIEEEAEILSAVDENNPLSLEDSTLIAKRIAKRQELWEEIDNQILSYADNEHEAYKAVYDFEWEKEFFFQDFLEIDSTEYTFGYIWCLYAIVWGIQQYDKAAKLTNEVPVCS